MSPIYEFECEKCGQVQEELFSSASRPEEINCSKCKGKAKRVLSTGQFKVNGANAANGYSGESNFKWVGVPEE